MKVHILWYDYYEDSDIIGIYTEEGKRKKSEELKAEALKFYQDVIDNLEYELQENASIEWSSSSNKVAEVLNGKITALEPGTVTIKAKVTLKKE